MSRVISVAEARERVATEPKRFKAAVIEGSAPLRDIQENKVVLYRLIKTAERCLNLRVKRLERQGWKRQVGNLGAGIVQLGRDDDVICVGIDKAGR